MGSVWHLLGLAEVRRLLVGLDELGCGVLQVLLGLLELGLQVAGIILQLEEAAHDLEHLPSKESKSLGSGWVRKEPSLSLRRVLPSRSTVPLSSRGAPGVDAGK